MSIDEGLASADAGKIKAARRIAKGLVTKNINIVKNKLAVEDGKYLFDEIDDNMVGEAYRKLDIAHDQFQDLHERYLCYREKETNPEDEEKTLEKEESYAQDVGKEFSNAERSYVKYKKALAASIEEHDKRIEHSARDMKIALLEGVMEEAKIDLDSKKEEAAKVIQSSDECVRSTANLIKEELITALAHYKSKVAEYKAATIVLKNSQDEGKYSPAQDVTDNIKEVDKLKFALAAMLFKDTGSHESIPMNSPAVTNINQSKSQDDKFLKLKKISPPKFSGAYRDFPKFKRDFNTIVAVEGRSDIEIGATLKESIPKRHEHLIDNLAVDEHREMMNILTRKFGNSRLIVNEIVTEIRGMKPVNTDKMFIEFVDAIDRIHRDLVELDLEAEIATTNMVTEIERKLPNLVRRDWSHEFMQEDEERSPKAMFDAFMKFLLKTQRMVEFHSLDTKQCSGQGRAFTNSSYVNGSTVLVEKGGAGNDRYGGGGINRNKFNEQSLSPCIVCNTDGCMAKVNT